MLSLPMSHIVHTKFRKNRPTSSTVPIKKEKQMNGMVISEDNCFRSECVTKETVLLNAGHINHVTAIVKNVYVY